MRKPMLFVPPVLAVLFATGCPATNGTTPATPVDLRAAHLAQVPATAQFVLQTDLSRTLDRAVVERWLHWLLPRMEMRVEPACALDLLGRARIMTEAMLRVDTLDEEAMILVSGELTAAEVAACLATLLDGEAPAPDAEGVYAFHAGREVLEVADFAAGGVVLASPAAMDLARGPVPAATAALAATPGYQQLRSRLGAGPFDLDAYSTLSMRGDGFRAEGIGVTLQRGATDRYEVVVEAGDADSANAIAMFVATLPLVIAGIEAEMDAAAREGSLDPALPAEAMTEALGVVAALREALTAAQTTVEGDVVRAVLEVDPTRASPTQILIVGGMLLFVRQGEGAAPPAPVEPEPSYGVPGVPGADVDGGQPPVE
ncbi:MAG: hypothetical protein GYA57_04015 [Myxococcales bacterium]|nr:hypothetical protein [Myxococcales bacterium]